MQQQQQHTPKKYKNTLWNLSRVSVSVSVKAVSVCVHHIWCMSVKWMVMLRFDVCVLLVLLFLLRWKLVRWRMDTEWMRFVWKVKYGTETQIIIKKTLTTTTNSTQKRERREKKPTAKQKSRNNCGCVFFWVDSCMELHDKMCNSLTKLNGKRQTAKYRASTHFCLYLVLYSSHFLPTSESRSLSLCTAS